MKVQLKTNHTLRGKVKKLPACARALRRIRYRRTVDERRGNPTGVNVIGHQLSGVAVNVIVESGGNGMDALIDIPYQLFVTNDKYACAGQHG